MRITLHGRRTAIVLTLAAIAAAPFALPAGANGTGDEPSTHDHGTAPDGAGGTPSHDGGDDSGGDDNQGGEHGGGDGAAGGAEFGHGAALTGAAEAPGPGDPDGAGLARVALDPDSGQACLHLEVANIAAPTLAHIHEGPAGVAGPVVVDFTPTLNGDECVDGVDGALLARITTNPAGFYVNVHNTRFPAGAVRGQLFASDGLADEVALPPGFRPEGIAVAPDGTFYVGSLAAGAIYRGELGSGEGAVFVEPVEGQVAVGLHLHDDQLWVAGGATGAARVYDAASGELLQSWQLTSGTTFINDVVVTGDTAWFTDSVNPVLYGVRLGDDQPTTLPLTGDLQFVSGTNTNGIETTDGTTLVVVQSPTGLLFTVDPATGLTTEIDLGGETVVNGDGLLFADGFLYVVQNQRNQIARVDLADDLTSGTVVTRLTDPDLAVPTTVGTFAGRLWAVNARFGTEATPTTFYSVVSVRG